ncbi:Nuclease HARBI1 [Oopsacas minuta]|uniref:Nuclease HARBI1 n=1 Tax=Oopsacas minuta TaxID=111878 RepID=A0AAV7JIA4_9METZ|nr:Nuclease HARBI1 [Oopsacas minuta]
MTRQRVFRDLNDLLGCHDDMELVRRFRFPRVSISKITELRANYLNFTERSYAASPHLQVCVGLQFFASGTFQIFCGDGINVSQASVSRYIRDVSLGLQAIYLQFVSLPGGFKRVEVKNKFYEIAHFPGVVGLVDGTHTRIQRPSEDEADYINRHFYHSINIQAICQPDGMFSDVLVHFPGSVPDSRIWKISGVGMHVENTILIEEHILGDSCT